MKKKTLDEAFAGIAGEDEFDFSPTPAKRTVEDYLKDLSDDALKRELERRKALPVEMAKPNFEALVGVVRSYLQDVREGNPGSRMTWCCAISNEAIRAVYGGDGLEWLRKRGVKV